MGEKKDAILGTVVYNDAKVFMDGEELKFDTGQTIEITTPNIGHLRGFTYKFMRLEDKKRLKIYDCWNFVGGDYEGFTGCLDEPDSIDFFSDGSMGLDLQNERPNLGPVRGEKDSEECRKEYGKLAKQVAKIRKEEIKLRTLKAKMKMLSASSIKIYANPNPLVKK